MPRAFLRFSSTSTSLEREKEIASPDSLLMRRAVEPTRNQFTRRFTFFLRLIFLRTEARTKLPKAVFLNRLFFLLGCMHTARIASLLSPTHTSDSLSTRLGAGTNQQDRPYHGYQKQEASGKEKRVTRRVQYERDSLRGCKRRVVKGLEPSTIRKPAELLT